jgi:hypothetical protein
MSLRGTQVQLQRVVSLAKSRDLTMAYLPPQIVVPVGLQGLCPVAPIVGSQEQHHAVVSAMDSAVTPARCMRIERVCFMGSGITHHSPPTQGELAVIENTAHAPSLFTPRLNGRLRLHKLKVSEELSFGCDCLPCSG